jgi:hypothetical protein
MHTFVCPLNKCRVHAKNVDCILVISLTLPVRIRCVEQEDLKVA